MRKLKGFISRMYRNENGFSSLLALLITIPVAIAFIVLLVSILNVGVTWSKLDYASKTIATEAADAGELPSDAVSEAAQYSGIPASKLTVSWNAQYFDESAGKLAFRQPFTLTVSTPVALPFSFGNGGTVFTVRVPAHEGGVSGVYWK